MNSKYQKIWKLALPYLKKGTMKDFVLHTNYVVKSMEMIVEGEGGEPDIMIPAAILHDVGWSKVDPSFQSNAELEKKREGQKQHLIFAKEIIEEVLGKAGYSQDDIARIVAIVEAHKFQDPAEKEKQMLIDADNLSDTFKESFEADVKSYRSTPKQVYGYRTQNQYYTQTAKEIARKNMIELQKYLDLEQDLSMNKEIFLDRYGNSHEKPVDRMVLHRDSIYGIAIEEKKILLVKAPDFDFWVLPGGGADKDESIEEALRREFLEETGFEICSVKELFFSEQLNFYAINTDLYYDSHCKYFIVTRKNQKRDLSKLNLEDSGKIRWFNLKNFNLKIVNHASRSAIEELIKKRSLIIENNIWV